VHCAVCPEVHSVHKLRRELDKVARFFKMEGDAAADQK